ncbi:hypothetical protein CBS101457_003532 [Exobasidium rhododendri]|nr:hypothetical protein CBS101457_003532 [Exobasidium rhododendri]
MSGSGDMIPLFKKKVDRKREVRPRDSATSSASHLTSTFGDALADDGDASTVILKRRKIGTGGLKNPLLQATGNGSLTIRAREDEEEEDLKLDLYGESSVSSVVRSDPVNGLKGLDNRGDATRETDWYNEGKGGVANTAKDGPNNDDGVYRGTSSYNTFITNRDDGVSAKLKAATKGPIRAGNNVRTITVVDYQPDVCKDYKETGYCGFGDTCKFMHDRSDYLAGWQLDSLPNSKARRGGDESEDEEEGEEIPFACLICRKAFTDPIITKCGHYFCSACAIKRFGKTSKCFACGKQTQGIFNSAGKVLERMETARKVREEAKDQRRWNRGETGPDEEHQQASGQLLEGVEIGGAFDDE